MWIEAPFYDFTRRPKRRWLGDPTNHPDPGEGFGFASPVAALG